MSFHSPFSRTVKVTARNLIEVSAALELEKQKKHPKRESIDNFTNLISIYTFLQHQAKSGYLFNNRHEIIPYFEMFGFDAEVHLKTRIGTVVGGQDYELLDNVARHDSYNGWVVVIEK